MQELHKLQKMQVPFPEARSPDGRAREAAHVKRVRRMVRRIQSTLWWAISLTTIFIAIAGVAMLIGSTPDWMIYRSGGLNPVVHMPD